MKSLFDEWDKVWERMKYYAPNLVEYIKTKLCDAHVSDKYTLIKSLLKKSIDIDVNDLTTLPITKAKHKEHTNLLLQEQLKEAHILNHILQQII